MGSAVITGVGTTGFGRLGLSADELAARAGIRALADAGLGSADVDGLLAVRVSSYGLLASRLGIESDWSLQLPAEGRMTGVALAAAKRALESGDCTTLLVVYGNDGRSGGHTYGGGGATSSVAGEGYGTAPAVTRAAGMTSPGAFYALMADRYRHEFGIADDAFGHVATTIRRHAGRNPAAVMRQSLTMTDYRAARFVARPLRLFDYCLINDGGVALVMTTDDRARDGSGSAVFVRGVGQAGALRTSDLPSDDFWRRPIRQASDAALGRAGVGRADIDALMVYDNFSPNVVFGLEGAGYCGPGEGTDWFAAGHADLDGDLPVNTSGGHLSESYLQGWGLIAEAVRQLRGEATGRQVPDARTIQYLAPAPIVTSVVLGKEAP